MSVNQPWRDPERYKTGRMVKCLGCNIPRIERIDAAFAPIRAALQSEKTP